MEKWMIARYFMERQYKPKKGLGKYRDEILKLIKLKSQDTTFSLGFNPRRRVSKLWLNREQRKCMLEPLDKQYATKYSPIYMTPSQLCIVLISHSFQNKWARTWTCICRPEQSVFHLCTGIWFARRCPRSIFQHAGWDFCHMKLSTPVPSSS